MRGFTGHQKDFDAVSKKIGPETYTAEAKAVDRLDNTAFDKVQFIYDNYPEILSAAGIINYSTNVLFYKYVASEGQTVFTGQDVNERNLNVSGNPIVFVNYVERVTGTFSFNVEGTEITFNEPLHQDDIVMISAFYFDPDGGVIFDFQSSNIQGLLDAALAASGASSLAQQNAETAQTAAQLAYSLADAARILAESASATAIQSSTLAGTYSDSAAGHALAALNSETIAVTQATLAQQSAATATLERQSAETARAGAEVATVSATLAQQSAESAAALSATSATNAATAETEAGQHAAAAATHTSVAESYATSAAQNASATAQDVLSAETAQAGAVAAQTTAVAAQQSAEAASAAALNSQVLSANSATEAGNHATAALASSQSAASSATTASQEASVATSERLLAETARAGAEASEASAATSATTATNAASNASSSETVATNAATAAGNSATAAANSASTASSEASDAAGSAASAASSESVTAQIAAEQFPHDFEREELFWVPQSNLAADTTNTIAGIATFPVIGGRKVAEVTGAAARVVRVRALAPAVAGHTYRVTIQARQTTGTLRSVRAWLRTLSSTYTLVQDAFTTFTFTSLNTWETFSATITLSEPLGAEVWVGAFWYNWANTVSDVFQIRDILFEDVTESTNAAASASAAATSASTAAASETAAGQHAAAAQTAETNAQTAQAGAEAAETQAATSATNAAGSEAAAASSASVAATAVVNAGDYAGGNLIVDPIFEENWADNWTGDSNTTLSVYDHSSTVPNADKSLAITGTGYARYILPLNHQTTLKGRTLRFTGVRNASGVEMKVGIRWGAIDTNAHIRMQTVTLSTTPGAWEAFERDFTLLNNPNEKATNIVFQMVQGAADVSYITDLRVEDVTSEVQAAGSATAAANSASTASTQATNAAQSATAAQSAQTAAETAEAGALASEIASASSETNAGASAVDAAASALFARSLELSTKYRLMAAGAVSEQVCVTNTTRNYVFAVAKDGTSIFKNGAPMATLNRGDLHTESCVFGDSFTADGPFTGSSESIQLASIAHAGKRFVSYRSRNSNTSGITVNILPLADGQVRYAFRDYPGTGTHNFDVDGLSWEVVTDRTLKTMALTTTTDDGDFTLESTVPCLVYIGKSVSSDENLLWPVSERLLTDRGSSLVMRVDTTKNLVQNGTYYHIEDYDGYVACFATGDGAGTDSEQFLPYDALGDEYILPQASIADYRILTDEAITVYVRDKNGTVIGQHDIDGSVTPTYLDVGNQAGNGTAISTNGPFYFSGTGKFGLRSNNNEDEFSAFGWLRALEGMAGVGAISAGIYHASYAETQADAAYASAQAAETSRINAEGAQGAAEAASTLAVGYRDDAAGSAASALASATLAARTSTRGVSVFRAPTLWSSADNNYMDRWSTGGTLTITPGTVYEAGWDWTFDVTDTQDTGLQMHTYHPGWFGAKDVEAFIVEVEFTLNSGSMDGAGVYARWYNTTGGGATATCRLVDMEISGATGEVQTASTILKRPAGFTGTFDKIHSHFFAGWGGFPPRVAKNITVHRWSMIPTSINEARIDKIETLDLSAGTALATFLNEMQVDANGNSAAVATFSQTSADVTGFASAFSGVTVSTNGGNVAGFYLNSWADPDGSGGSMMKLLGDVIVPGSVSTNLLAVGLGQNMVPDPRFSEGLAHWSGNVTSGTGGADTTFEVRPAGQTWAGLVDPTLMMFQATAATDGYHQRELKPVINADGGVAHGFPVVAGRTYSASIRASAHRCNAKAWVRWMDASGAHISYSGMGANANNAGSSTQPNTWPLLSVVDVAPAGAFYARLMVRKEATYAAASPANSYAFWAEPMFAETHADATDPTPYSPPGQTVIDGDRLRTGSVTAEKITVADLAALNITVVNADIENATLTTAKLAAGAIQRTFEWFSDIDVTVPTGTGWRQVMSKTVTTYNANPVLISVIIESAWAYGSMEMKIERDGVNILDTGAYSTRLFQKTAPDLMFSDRPGAGTFTYTVSIKQHGDYTNTLKRRHMILQQGMS